MEIQLPSTLNAVYVEGEFDRQTRTFERGVVELRFGESKIGQLPVTDNQHKRLSADGFIASDEYRQRELDDVVAAWLQEKWGMREDS
jgi:hypothetical protein